MLIPRLSTGVCSTFGFLLLCNLTLQLFIATVDFHTYHRDAKRDGSCPFLPNNLDWPCRRTELRCTRLQIVPAPAGPTRRVMALIFRATALTRKLHKKAGVCGSNNPYAAAAHVEVLKHNAIHHRQVKLPRRLTKSPQPTTNSNKQYSWHERVLASLKSTVSCLFLTIAHCVLWLLVSLSFKDTLDSPIADEPFHWHTPHSAGDQGSSELTH